MKMWTAVVCLVLAVVVPNIYCKPANYGGASGGSSGAGKNGSGGSSGGGSGGYGGSSSGVGGGYRGYMGTLASDALKNSYNNFDGNIFNFGYDVQDSQHNNFQSRQESGSGDPKGQVTGSYTLLEADGSTRTVEYVADWVNGFRATVRDKNGVTQHGYNTDGGDGSYDGHDDSSAGGHGGSSGDANVGHGGASGGAGGYGGSSSGSSGGHGGASGGARGSSAGTNGGHGGASGGSDGSSGKY